jgi:hypothetical protein
MALGILPRKGSYYQTIEFNGITKKIWVVKHSGGRGVTVREVNGVTNKLINRYL